MTDFGLRFSDFGLRSPDFGLRSPDFGLRSSVSDLRTSVFGLRSSVSDLRTSVFGLRSSVSDLRTSVFGLRTSDFRLNKTNNKVQTRWITISGIYKKNGRNTGKTIRPSGQVMILQIPENVISSICSPTHPVPDFMLDIPKDILQPIFLPVTKG